MKLLTETLDPHRVPAEVEHPRPILFSWRVDENGLSETVAHVNNVT